MKVKICGITNLHDAVICEELGADATGFVNVRGRQRSIPLDLVRDICSTLGPMTAKVLVCAPSDAAQALRMLERSGADLLQLHSLVPEEIHVLKAHGVGIIRAVPPVRAEAARFAECADALLFEGGPPGTGTAYDYSSVPLEVCRRGIIAGGLRLDNLHLAKAAGPYALDVSSGVERAPGRKDPALVTEFIRRCRE